MQNEVSLQFSRNSAQYLEWRSLQQPWTFASLIKQTLEHLDLQKKDFWCAVLTYLAYTRAMLLAYIVSHFHAHVRQVPC